MEHGSMHTTLTKILFSERVPPSQGLCTLGYTHVFYVGDMVVTALVADEGTALGLGGWASRRKWMIALWGLSHLTGSRVI